MADVIAIFYVLLFLIGRCYCHVVDVCHYYVLFMLADVIAMWLMLLPLMCSDVWLMLLPRLGVKADVIA